MSIYNEIDTLFENIGKTYLIPGYDYKDRDMKAQEEFIKKKQNEKSKNKIGKSKREKGGSLFKNYSKLNKYYSY